MSDLAAILIGVGVGALAAIPTALLLVALLRYRQAQIARTQYRVWPDDPAVALDHPVTLLLEDGDEQPATV